jgi:hypothetical protein
VVEVSLDSFADEGAAGLLSARLGDVRKIVSTNRPPALQHRPTLNEATTGVLRPQSGNLSWQLKVVAPLLCVPNESFCRMAA